MRPRGVLAAASQPQWPATWAASAQPVGPFPDAFSTGLEIHFALLR